MQLFITSPDPFLCANYLDDKRLNKQIIECIQILSTALWMRDCNIAETLYSKGKIYLPTHENHPICKNAKYHYLDILRFTGACTYEYLCRFYKNHKCLYYLIILYDYFYLFEEKYPHKPFLNCTTNHKHISDVYKAYKAELHLKWSTDKVQPKWSNRVTDNL